MSLEEQVIKWNATWKRDWWYRSKYNLPFNSERHREISQVDIHFEYIEEYLHKKILKDANEKLEKEKRLKETGKWIEEKTLSESEVDKLFKNIDLSKL